MKNVLQSIVKIIIVGSFCGIFCNGHFFPEGPPFPYYRDQQPYAPNRGPPFHQPQPYPDGYFPTRNYRPRPAPYENDNYFFSPYMTYFEEYNSPQFVKPKDSYRDELPSYLSSLKMNIEPSQENFNILRAIQRSTDNSRIPHFPQAEEHVPTIIIEKTETIPVYYDEDGNQGFLEDDYSESDAYNDDDSSHGEPAAIGYPYKHFKPSKHDSNNENEKIRPPCPPSTESDMKNIVSCFKSPITILPSRFPPRIEQLIEKIQNYFSTYNQPEGQKPVKNPATTTTTSTEPTTTNENVEPISTTTDVTSPSASPNISEEIERVTTTKATHQTENVQYGETTVKSIPTEQHKQTPIIKRPVATKPTTKEKPSQSENFTTEKAADNYPEVNALENSTTTKKESEKPSATADSKDEGTTEIIKTTETRIKEEDYTEVATEIEGRI